MFLPGDLDFGTVTRDCIFDEPRVSLTALTVP